MRTAIILRVSRIIISAVCFAVIAAACTEIAMLCPPMAKLLLKVQFLPAATTFSLGIIAFWLLVTLIFGRVYCSSVCPLGFWQDIFARITRLKPSLPSSHYHFQPSQRTTRIAWLVITLIAIFLGITPLISLLDPFGLFSKFCASVIIPISDHLKDSPTLIIGGAALAAAAVSTVCMIALAVMSARKGRKFCNTICPVGTTLGFVSRHAIFHIDINTDRCINCRACEHACKASCIDLTSHIVDSSRCINCFDCLPGCPNDAIHYTWDRHQLSRPLMQRIPQIPPVRKQSELAGTVKITKNETVSRPSSANNDRRG